MEADLQDEHLRQLRAQSAEVSVYLVNGLRLVGRISAFDQYGLVLERGGMHQFVYKRAISTVSAFSEDSPAPKRKSSPPVRGKTVGHSDSSTL